MDRHNEWCTTTHSIISWRLLWTLNRDRGIAQHKYWHWPRPWQIVEIHHRMVELIWNFGELSSPPVSDKPACVFWTVLRWVPIPRVFPKKSPHCHLCTHCCTSELAASSMLTSPVSAHSPVDIRSSWRDPHLRSLLVCLNSPLTGLIAF